MVQLACAGPAFRHAVLRRPLGPFCPGARSASTCRKHQKDATVFERAPGFIVMFPAVPATAERIDFLSVLC